MRGIPSLITDIRKKVFTEVARMAYAGKGYEEANELPYTIVPGDRPLHRESVFLERAIAGNGFDWPWVWACVLLMADILSVRAWMLHTLQSSIMSLRWSILFLMPAMLAPPISTR